MADSQNARGFNIGSFIQILRSQHREGYSDQRLFNQALAFFRQLKAGPLLETGRILAEPLLKEFEEEGIGLYVEKLTAFGVREETLFVALLMFGLMPQIDETLRKAFGNIKQRRRKAEVLREAAVIMDEIAGSDQRIPKWLSKCAPVLKAVPLPSEVADALHMYASTLSIREQLREALDLNSGVELAKFTLASAVHRITGKYHDRETAAVFSVLLFNPDYDETAHRVWRIRTLPRLNRSCAYLPIILHALNSVLVESVEESANHSHQE